jgi:trehalose 6-phosphate synthase/phosphatase
MGTPSSRVVIVANRLPVSIKKTEDGLVYTPSTGGLATGLRSLRGELDTCWIGWPGHVPKEHRSEVEQHLGEQYGAFPVFLTESLAVRYYAGYSNRTLWPIFHSLPTLARYSAPEWEAYRKANQFFFRTLKEHYRPGDIVWIHDYHLMLLPQFIREEFPDATIGFFLHIPFPHADIFRLIPQHRELLHGLLSVDLAGFHTHDYAQAFLGSIRRLIGYDNTLGQILVGERVVQADVFPMGIDFERYSTAPANPAVQQEIAVIRNTLRTRKVVFSVSRLDYTKGIPQSLSAVDEFLTRYPQWHGTFVYVLVVVPSRESVDQYATLKREIDELVGRINSTFGSIGWQPIRYIYRSLKFPELVGLYNVADVALITPLRDGMNLIAKEFLAVKNEGPGVLVLSEFTGAAKELLEALVVHPHSKEDIAEAIHRALEMPEDEQRRRNVFMAQRLHSHDIHMWVRRFFERLKEVQDVSRNLAVKILDGKSRNALRLSFARAEAPLLLLDYDGTLVPFAAHPEGAKPDHDILDTLGKLAAPERTSLVIVSGRDRGTLEAWLGRLPITIVAEHGGWIRPRGGEWFPSVGQSEELWKRDIRPIMDLFVERIPGSFVEEKDFSLVWHFRKADRESASGAARELLDTLANITTNMNIQVLPGNKTVEVRHFGINKGAYFTRYHSAEGHDFVLAIGDDWTDEDLFAVLPPTAYSIKVAPRITRARFNVRTVDDVRALLLELAEGM